MALLLAPDWLKLECFVIILYYDWLTYFHPGIDFYLLFFSDSSLVRYDPTRDDHAQFEQKPKKQDDRPEPAVKESQQEATEVMRSAPEVTTEKFYDVKTNVLTEMFTKKKSVSC